MSAFWQQFRMIAVYQWRKLPLVLLVAVFILAILVPFALNAFFSPFATAELSQQLMTTIIDVGCSLVAAAWACDTGGNSLELDRFLRRYKRYSFSRSTSYLAAAWLILGVIALATIALTLARQSAAEASFEALAGLALWLKLVVIYTGIAAFRYLLSPRWRMVFVFCAFAAVQAAFYAAPYLNWSPGAIGTPLLALLAMDYSQFTTLFLPSAAAAGTLATPLATALAFTVALPLAIMALISEITGFFGELSSH